MKHAALLNKPAPFDVAKIREDFPGLHQKVGKNPLVFLDSAASAQKPTAVLECLQRAYAMEYANIHRGMYHLSELATRHFEAVRDQVARFIGAARREELIFTKGATEGINLVAQCYGMEQLKEGDEIILSTMEHHANIVPWQQVAKQTGAVIKVAPIHPDGSLDLDAYRALLTERTQMVSMLHMSNALGTILPMKQIIADAHAVGAKVLVDACQSIVHMPTDVAELDADFLVFSGHKLYGPTGVGVLYGTYDLLEQMPPYQTGGEMIDQVSFDGTSFQPPPLRFEAGTPAIAEVIALGAALDYICAQDRDAIAAHEQELLEQATIAISELPHFTIIGTAEHKDAVISLHHDTAHANDIGLILDQCGIAVRAGHHCAQPLMQHLGIPATARISFGMYNTLEEIEALTTALHKVNKFFG